MFKKEERASQGAKAMAEYKAEVEAERAKTARLKALRLAKAAAGDVAEQPEVPLAQPSKKALRGKKAERLRRP